MARGIKTLGLIAAAVFAVVAMAPSSASAATFTANVLAEEKAQIDIEQIGTGETITIGSKKVTCATVTTKGEALEKGSTFAEITVTPSYENCHLILFGVTRTVTITVNSCAYKLKAVSSTTASMAVECPEGKQIEIHWYNALNGEAETLCTYDIEPQAASGTIGLTNNAKTPSSADDLTDVPSLEIKLHNTKQTALCGLNETETANFQGEATLRATAYVDVSVD